MRVISGRVQLQAVASFTIHAQQAPTSADHAAAARANAERNQQAQQQRDAQHMLVGPRLPPNGADASDARMVRAEIQRSVPQ
ncbi:hypothetical protein C6Q02_03195 [Burkholderia multivorans]|nr:hypothetical protein C6Q02_03195 [Burkholderia multivorans]PTO49865.1 hypothetical protein DBB31_05735 [Burkholderia multivorans]